MSTLTRSQYCAAVPFALAQFLCGPTDFNVVKSTGQKGTLIAFTASAALRGQPLNAARHDLSVPL